MTMKIRIAFILVLAGLTAARAENLLENADFSKGSRRWEGHWEPVTTDDGNTVAAVEADENRMRTLFQRIEVRNKTFELALKMKYKAGPDYTGRGFRLLFERPDTSYTYRDISVKPGGDWTPLTWDFSDIKGAKTLILRIEVRQGSGTLYFDDFSLEPK